MNKEIEKILEIKEDCDYKKLSIEAIMLLQDYITDLEKRFNSLLEAHKICNEELEEKEERIANAAGFIRFICFNSERPLTTSELNKLFYMLVGSDKE